MPNFVAPFHLQIIHQLLVIIKNLNLLNMAYLNISPSNILCYQDEGIIKVSRINLSGGLARITR